MSRTILPKEGKIMSRIKVISSVVVLGLVFLVSLILTEYSGAAEKSKYPNKPIKWIVMWRSGGGADTATRIYTRYLEKLLGQKIIVENITGAGGSIGYTVAKGAKPDGYRLLTIQFDLPWFKPNNVSGLEIGDFDIVGSFASQSPIMTAQSKAPWNTVKDFVVDAKKKPGKLTIGVSNIAGLHHLPVVLWMDIARFNAKAIAHPGSPQMNAALLGGHVDIINSYVRPAKPYVKEGTLKFLGYFGSGRLPDYPDVPTFRELGYDIIWVSPYGIGGPKGMPENVKKVLSDANKKVWEIPEFKKDLENLGLSVYRKDGSAYTQYLYKLQEGITKAVRVIKE